MTLLAGQILRAADINDEITALQASTPRGRLGFVVQSTNQIIANDPNPFNSTSIAVNVEANRKLRIVWSGSLTGTVAADEVNVWIVDVDTGNPVMPDNGVVANRCRAQIPSNFGNVPGFFEANTTNTTAGVRTFRVVVSMPSGTGPVGFNAGATISVYDAGPA